jgi:hypothetical protein
MADIHPDSRAASRTAQNWMPTARGAQIRSAIAERPQAWNIPLMASFSEGTLHVICPSFAVGSALISFVYIGCAFLVALRFTGVETYGLFIAAFGSECLTLYLYALFLLKPKEQRES